jgi:hypothetical protein
MTMADQMVYQQGDTRVTTTQLEAGGRSYRLADMHSASLDERSNRRIYGWATLLVGLALAVGGYLLWRTLLPPVIGGLALILAGGILLATARSSKVVKIRDQAGAVIAIPVPDEASGHRIIAAVDAARDAGRERAVGAG